MIYIFIIIPLIICFYIFLFSMGYAAKKSDEQAEQLFNDMMKGKNFNSEKKHKNETN